MPLVCHIICPASQLGKLVYIHLNKQTPPIKGSAKRCSFFCAVFFFVRWVLFVFGNGDAKVQACNIWAVFISDNGEYHDTVLCIHLQLDLASKPCNCAMVKTSGFYRRSITREIAILRKKKKPVFSRPGRTTQFQRCFHFYVTRNLTPTHCGILPPFWPKGW